MVVAVVAVVAPLDDKLFGMDVTTVCLAKSENHNVEEEIVNDAKRSTLTVSYEKRVR